ILSVLLGFILFGLSIWTIAQEFRKYHPRKVLHSLDAIAPEYLLLAVGRTALNYLMLTGYDSLAVRYVRRRLNYGKIALVSIISYAISNSVGFALLSGSAIRYRFYTQWGFSKIEISKIIAFCNLSFWIGLFAVGGVSFSIEPVQIPKLLHLPFQSVQPIGVIFSVLILGYLAWNIWGRSKVLAIGRWKLPHLPVKLSLAQIAVTSCDWTLAAGVLYLLLPTPTPLSFPGFFGIYLLAQLAGIISNVPGGLGVFETVLLFLLSPPVDSAALLGTLLAYRGIYYCLPLLVSVLLWGLYEMRAYLSKRG
ncbi:MAG: lysylphosphatidylglycerol synthase domain-containing protein, partial [Spirulinaceae cyanobacterium]